MKTFGKYTLIAGFALASDGLSITYPKGGEKLKTAAVFKIE